ncbi:MAG: hypothetical protein ACFFCS_02180 [Candidatus Hodarchaeota archaeon]
MDYLGFSIYSRTFMGDLEMLRGFGIEGNPEDIEPGDVFPVLLEDVDRIVDQFPEIKDLGTVIHFCNIMGLIQSGFIIEPWKDALKGAAMKYPFVLGYHINFDHANLPLAPGFMKTFKAEMQICTELEADAMVLHAPLFDENKDDDWIKLMTSPGVVELMRSNDTVLCWENAQDTIAYYRHLKHLITWREKLVKEYEKLGHDDLLKRNQFCLDTGHFLVSLQRDGAPRDEIDEYLPEFGKNVKVFHIQANDGLGDNHLIPFLPVEKYKIPRLKSLDVERFKKNSQLVVDFINTCNENKQVDGRHVHLEVDNPMPMEEMVGFYKRYFG